MKKHLNSWFKKATAITCGLAVILSSTFVFADDISDLEEKTSTLQGELDSLNQKMLALSENISTTEMQIELTDSAILRTQSFLEEALADEKQQYDDMEKRIKFIYESGDASLLEMLFSATDMADFLNKAEFIESVSEYDREMMNELRAAREEVELQKTNLEEAQESLHELEDELHNQKEALEEEAEATSTDLKQFTAELNRLKEEEARRLEEEAQKAEEDRKAAEERADSDDNDSNSTVHTNGSAIQSGNAMNVTPDDVTLLAAIIQCEAYHQYNYMLAVATVILNRVESPRFPNTIHDVVNAPGQFAPTWYGSLARVLAEGPTDLAYQVAQDAINGARLAEVADCYYFLAESQNVTGVNVGGNVFFQTWGNW